MRVRTTLVAVLILGALAACKIDSTSLDPGVQGVAGSFSLATINGKALPDSIGVDSTGVLTAILGRATFATNGQYVMSVTFFGSNDPGNTHTLVRAGPYTQNGAGITMTDTTQAAPISGQIVGSELEIQLVDRNLFLGFVRQ